MNLNDVAMPICRFWFNILRNVYPSISPITDALFVLRRQWVREEDLAKSLRLHSKQLRRTLRFFEEEKLITRDHRKEVSMHY